MSNLYEIFSSGGVGDCLILGLKIQQLMANFHSDEEIIWRHFEKHACHEDACLDMMGQFVEKREIYIMDKPEAAAKQMCEDIGGHYLDTVIAGVMHPYLKHPIGAGEFMLQNGNLELLTGHIVVQAQAGRMHDNTKRIIGPQVINQLLGIFPKKHVVILGIEPYDFKHERVLNVSGKTPSVIDALPYINDCKLFVGQDGVMAYYAMMLKKWTIVAYHIPTLINHYWNERWAHHALALRGAGNVLPGLPDHEKIRTMIDIIQKEG